MAEINIGRVRLSWKGTWDAGTTYTALDAVSHGGSSYVAIAAPPVGTAPVSGAHWQLLASKGDPGPAGGPGAPGTPGAPGEPGPPGADGVQDNDPRLPVFTGANLAVGVNALEALDGGTNNTASGYSALRENTTGNNNTASGGAALFKNTTGTHNTASGYSALRENTTGNSNTASGYSALRENTTGSSNTASGYSALQLNTTGTNSTASGYAALRENTTGTHNTASGYSALRENATGNDNVAVGFEAGRRIGDGSPLTKANASIFIGAGARPWQDETENEIVIGYGAAGNGADTVRIGNNSTKWTQLSGIVYSSADNTHTLGGSAYRWKELFCASATINTSDAREKTPVGALTPDEIAAAKQLAKEIGSFKFLAAIAEKGEGLARVHIGMTVQRAIEVMERHGLDPMAYSFICYDEWDERAIDHIELEEERDDDGNVIAEAQEAHREVVQPAGDRYSFRASELLLFIAAGFEARLTALEES